MNIIEIGQKARSAARELAGASSDQKNALIYSLGDALHKATNQILEANGKDISAGNQNELSSALIDRLRLSTSRLADIALDLQKVAELPDPVGEIFDNTTLPNGLQVHKQRVPLGVLGVIYESRPNVTLDIAGLAIKTGNAIILRGGKETLNTNRTLVSIVRDCLGENNLPIDAVQSIDDPDRARVYELLQMYEYVDMLIPRGGEALHKFCRENSRIPVITGGIGICHLFVDESADQTASLEVIRNAKIQRPTVCNALDTVLVHHKIAASFLPQLVAQLANDGVALRADKSVTPYLNHIDPEFTSAMTPAGQADFDTEWLSLVLGVKIVKDLNEAISHISDHSTGHSDGILTNSESNAKQFVSEVDSAAVYVNASTRFTDGGQLGLGAEVAISTQRLHARGPMGLQELTTYKWVVNGKYHIRS